MKTLLITTFTLICPVFISGQVTKLHNTARGGDRIIKQQVAYENPGKAGKDILWDFSKLKPAGEEYVLEYLEPEAVNDSVKGDIYIMGLDTFRVKEIEKGELMMGIEHHTVYYYRFKDDWLTMLGFENQVTMMRYPKPLFMMPYPLEFERKATTRYESEGTYSYDSYLATDGDMLVEADATGRMVIPSGDTLDHVIRVRTVQGFQETAKSVKARTAGLTEASKRSDTPINTSMETCRWYAKGYRYPIFETIRTLDLSSSAGKELAAKEKKETFKTAFFYSPESHYYLEEDMANLSVLEEINKNKDKNKKELRSDTAYPSGRSMEGSYWSCGFSPNPVSDILTIRYETTADAPVTILLYNASGRLLQSIPRKQQTAGIYHESIDFASLPTGSYILKAVIGNESASRIVIKK